MDTWAFDAFALNSTELCAAALAIFERAGAFESGFCSRAVAWEFINACRKNYLGNPYHNFRHAVDVLQALYRILDALARAGGGEAEAEADAEARRALAMYLLQPWWWAAAAAGVACEARAQTLRRLPLLQLH